jgi:hypothetical protein
MLTIRNFGIRDLPVRLEASFTKAAQPRWNLVQKLVIPEALGRGSFLMGPVYPRFVRRFGLLVGLGLVLGVGGCGAGDTGGDPGATEAASETGESGEWSPEGLRLGDVSFNSGVQTFVIKDGEWIDGKDLKRNSIILPDRKALVWVDYHLTEDWTPRDVDKRLLLVDESGVETTLSNSGPLTLNNSVLEWIIEPGVIKTGMEFAIELVEVQEEFGPGTTLARIPDAGTEQIGVQPLAPDIKVVLVPVHVQFLQCDALPELTQAHADEVRGFLQAALPVGSVEVVLRESPLFLDRDPAVNWPDGELVVLREQAGDDPSVLYFAHIPSCSMNGQVSWDVSSRVAASIQPNGEPAWEDGVPVELDVFGLVHGLLQVDCEMAAQNPPDPDYPYDDGRIGVWGFNINTEEVYPPDSTYSVLSPCHPAWFSDYEWLRLNCLERGDC